MSDRVAQIEQRLRAALQPLRLEIKDESAKHAGHAGAREGGGHFDVTIVADAVCRQRPSATSPPGL